MSVEGGGWKVDGRGFRCHTVERDDAVVTFRDVGNGGIHFQFTVAVGIEERSSRCRFRRKAVVVVVGIGGSPADGLVVGMEDGAALVVVHSPGTVILLFLQVSTRVH